MDSLLQSDIFFFVSSIGFLVIAGLLVSILLYVIKIIKIVVEVMETVKNITKGVSEKIEDIGQITQSPLFM